MPREFNQKIKLLRIMEILRLKTDEKHALTTRELCRLLEDSGVPCERRTLSRDIALLIKNGYEIESRMEGHEKAYYTADTHFTESEICAIINAVMAAPFIGEIEAESLTEKIADLGGVSSKMFSDNVSSDNFIFDLPGRGMSSTSVILYRLSDAISKGETVSFYIRPGAGNINHMDKQDHVTGGSENYVQEDVCDNADEDKIIAFPEALVYSEGIFSFVCREVPGGQEKAYRVDDIVEIEIFPGMREQSEPDFDREHILDLVMGEREECVLSFAPELEREIRRRFGNDIYIERTPQGDLRVRLLVRADQAFWGWIFGYSGKIQIIAPRNLALRYLTWCRIMAQSIMESLSENEKDN